MREAQSTPRAGGRARPRPRKRAREPHREAAAPTAAAEIPQRETLTSENELVKVKRKRKRKRKKDHTLSSARITDIVVESKQRYASGRHSKNKSQAICSIDAQGKRNQAANSSRKRKEHATLIDGSLAHKSVRGSEACKDHINTGTVNDKRAQKRRRKGSDTKLTFVSNISEQNSMDQKIERASSSDKMVRSNQKELDVADCNMVPTDTKQTSNVMSKDGKSVRTSFSINDGFLPLDHGNNYPSSESMPPIFMHKDSAVKKSNGSRDGKQHHLDRIQTDTLAKSENTNSKGSSTVKTTYTKRSKRSSQKEKHSSSRPFGIERSSPEDVSSPAFQVGENSDCLTTTNESNLVLLTENEDLPIITAVGNLELKGSMPGNNSVSLEAKNSNLTECKQRRTGGKRRGKHKSSETSSAEGPSLQNVTGCASSSMIAEIDSVVKVTSDINNLPSAKCDAYPNSSSVTEIAPNNSLKTDENSACAEKHQCQDIELASSSINPNIVNASSSLLTKDQDTKLEAVPAIPKRSLISSDRKKLLVLDINGLLADIVSDYQCPYKADIKVSGKPVFKRPFCDEFLELCFQKFEIGIWSSRNRYNVDKVVDFLMGDLKRNLLFCWDQSKCTATGFQTIDNMHKPLVLKELKKLWDKDVSNLPWVKGDYSQSNTLLVDDSPYKAICNPPHTAIFPYPYDFKNREDNSLGPGGDLRLYLEGLAMTKDVQGYVQEHPFGQPAITDAHPSWKFYLNIMDKI